jgi:hypothetical protein
MPLTPSKPIPVPGSPAVSLDPTDISSSPEYPALLERFEALRLQVALEPSSRPDSPDLDLTQEDSFMPLAKNHRGTHSAPELTVPELDVDDVSPMGRLPFVFLFDPATSRSGRQASARTQASDYSDIIDDELRTLLDSIEGLSFEIAIEKYSLFARGHGYTDAIFLENLKYFSAAFKHIGDENLVSALRVINTNYKSMPRAFFSQVLGSLGFSYSGAQKLDLFIKARLTSDMVRELVNTPDGYHSRLIQSSSSAQAPALTPVTGHYTLVIVDDQGHNKMWIGQGNHYNIARGKKMVYFAGNINFDDEHQVVAIDDESGGYHGFKAENPAIRARRKAQLTQVLEEMGLPVEKFSSQFSERVDSDSPLASIGGSARLPRRRS